MDRALEALREAFDPERFRTQGHALIDALADQLGRAQRGEVPVVPWAEPDERLRDWPADFTPQGTGALLPLVERAVAQSTQLHHPRFAGHQVSAPLPSTALLELVSALLNNGTGVYEMGPASNAMERSVLRWMATQLGLPAAAGGVLTSGGSAGNLTALLALRQAKAGHDAWSEGTEPRYCVLASAQTHYSMQRSAQILGWGAHGVWPVPVDERFRMDPAALVQAQRDAEAAGRRVLGVVASAGSTSTGAFDALEPIADFCEARGLWLHVDGAHGASAALSTRYRGLLAGIERADSVVWDAHKMMLLPALVTAVLFRDEARASAAFAQQAAYLFGAGPQPWWDSAHRTLECTKRMMSLELYGALAVHGTQLFDTYVTRTFDLAKAFAQELQQSRDFVLATEPDCNIVCFRWTPKPLPPAELDALQVRARERIRAGGRFYLVQTRLNGTIYLRTTLIQPLTTLDDLRALLDEIRATPLDADARTR